MEKHEWNENTDEGKRFYRANYHAKQWRVMTSLKKEPWEILEEPATEIWEALRDVVWRKYQRKRCPFERVVELDKRLGRENE